MRIYPHLQDSGGFFITVLQRKSRRNVKSNPVSLPENTTDTQKRPVPDEDDDEDSLVASKKVKLSAEVTNEDGMEVDESIISEDDQREKKPSWKASGKKPEKQKTGHFKENPFTFIPPDDPGVQGCMYVAQTRRLTTFFMI